MLNLKKILTILSIGLFSAYTLLWLWLSFNADPQSQLREYFSDTYGVAACFGGIVGLLVSKKWGGLSSVVGRSLIFFSIGLFNQFLGQVSYSIDYYLLNIENSYPSYGEIFFLSSIPFYILGIINIANASGSKISMRDYKNRLSTLLFPLIMIGISYFMFIKGTPFEEFDLKVNILTFAYPIGQAIYVSLAILAYYLTMTILGGAMRKKVFFILFALLFQYAADSTFLYKTINETWYAADISEYLFVVSYFLMTIAFIQFLSALEKFKKPD